MTRILNTTPATTIQGHVGNAVLCLLALSVWALCWTVYFTCLGLYRGSRWLAIVAAPIAGRWLRDVAIPAIIEAVIALFTRFFRWQTRMARMERCGELWPALADQVKTSARDVGELAAGIAIVAGTLAVLAWREI